MFSELNIYTFRLINDLGKNYLFLNPFVVFVAEYIVYLLALSMILYFFLGKNENRIMVIHG